MVDWGTKGDSLGVGAGVDTRLKEEGGKRKRYEEAMLFKEVKEAKQKQPGWDGRKG